MFPADARCRAVLHDAIEDLTGATDARLGFEPPIICGPDGRLTLRAHPGQFTYYLPETRFGAISMGLPADQPAAVLVEKLAATIIDKIVTYGQNREAMRIAARGAYWIAQLEALR